jgi:hypothetical protein
MFDFIYSILKRCSLNKDKSLDSKNFLRVIITFIFVNMLFPVIYLLATYREFIEDLNSFLIIILFLIIGFIIMYPFFRIINPGYKYLENVKNYDTQTAYLYLILLFLPAILCLIIPYI